MMENCSDSPYEFNNLQKFWNSLLGICAKGKTFVFCFLTILLSVSLKFRAIMMRFNVGATKRRTFVFECLKMFAIFWTLKCSMFGDPAPWSNDPMNHWNESLAMMIPPHFFISSDFVGIYVIFSIKFHETNE